MELAVFCIVLAWVSTASGLVEFRESDYTAREGNTMRVGIAGTVQNDVIVELIPLTVESFMSTYSEPPPGGIGDSNHAETFDFSSARQRLRITPDTTGVTFEVHIFSDEVSEPEEVFVLVLNVISISPEDLTDSFRNVSIGRIQLDLRDEVTIQFSGVEFSINENEGEVSDLHIVKMGDSEDPITFTIELETDKATRGEDFEVGELQLMFRPNDRSQTVSFTIMEDSVPEGVETFQFRLGSFATGSAIVTLGTNTTATITIVDNDRLTAGFFQTETPLELQEGQTANICVALLQPDDIMIQLSFILDLSITLSGATEEHFNLEIDDCLISNGELRYKITLEATATCCCFNVTTVDDEVLERSRVIMMTLTDEQMSHPLLTVAPNFINATITDNDGTPNSPENLTLGLVNDDMDLLIMWDAARLELRPIEHFLVRFNVSNIPSETKQESVVEMFEFETENTQYTISSINPDKEYTIEVCSSNAFGVNCSRNLLTYAVPVPAEHSTGLEPGIIALIVSLAVLVAFLCCIFSICCLFCLTCWSTSGNQPLQMRRYTVTAKQKKYKKKKKKSTKKTVIV